MTADDQIIYKISPKSDWEDAERNGVFHGAAIDLSDGYIHFSTAAQAAETAAKHFSGQTDLLLVAVDADKLRNALKWEISRGDALFPHLYAPLTMDAVVWAKPIPLDQNGTHQLPLEKT